MNGEPSRQMRKKIVFDKDRVQKQVSGFLKQN